MKIGMNLLLWADRPAPSEHRNLLTQIKGWGFNGVEFHVNAFTDDDAREYRKICDDLELENISTIAFDANQFDPASEDIIKRQNAVDEIKRSVDKTLILGGNIIVGPLFQGLPRFSGSAPTQKEWAWAVECIRKGAEYAGEAGVRLALEPLNRFEMYIVNTMSEGYRFVKDTGMENVGLLADTFHSNIEEKNVIDSWDKVFDKIFHIHISENDRGIPGTGHAISEDLFKLIKKKNYNGWLSIEAFNNNVPGLISRLHLWRSYAPKDEDIAIQGIEYIKKNYNG